MSTFDWQTFALFIDFCILQLEDSKSQYMKQIENLQAEKDDLANRMKKLQEGMIIVKVA